MKIASVAVTPPAPLAAKPQSQAELNPAKQAKAAEPAVKGAAFGALVSETAHARNAARFAAKHGDPAPVEPPPSLIVDPPAETEEEVLAAPPPSAEQDVPAGTDTDATVALALLQGEPQPEI